MPLYEYRCLICGDTFEVIQKFNQPLLEKCPKCGGKLTKLLSPPMIQFKGSGWYKTDYAEKPKPKENKEDGKKVDGKEKKTSPSTQKSHHPPFAD